MENIHTDVRVTVCLVKFAKPFGRKWRAFVAGIKLQLIKVFNRSMKNEDGKCKSANWSYFELTVNVPIFVVFKSWGDGEENLSYDVNLSSIAIFILIGTRSCSTGANQMCKGVNQ